MSLSAQKPLPYTLIFEVENVLSKDHVYRTNEANYFREKGAILTGTVTHYILPGVIELFKRLKREEDVEIGFFADKNLDEDFLLCRKLFQTIFGEKEGNHHFSKTPFFTTKETLNLPMAKARGFRAGLTHTSRGSFRAQQGEC